MTANISLEYNIYTGTTPRYGYIVPSVLGLYPENKALEKIQERLRGPEWMKDWLMDKEERSISYITAEHFDRNYPNNLVPHETISRRLSKNLYRDGFSTTVIVRYVDVPGRKYPRELIYAVGQLRDPDNDTKLYDFVEAGFFGEKLWDMKGVNVDLENYEKFPVGITFNQDPLMNNLYDWVNSFHYKQAGFGMFDNVERLCQSFIYEEDSMAKFAILDYFSVEKTLINKGEDDTDSQKTKEKVFMSLYEYSKQLNFPIILPSIISWEELGGDEDTYYLSIGGIGYTGFIAYDCSDVFIYFEENGKEKARVTSKELVKRLGEMFDKIIETGKLGTYRMSIDMAKALSDVIKLITGKFDIFLDKISPSLRMILENPNNEWIFKNIEVKTDKFPIPRAKGIGKSIQVDGGKTQTQYVSPESVFGLYNDKLKNVTIPKPEKIVVNKVKPYLTKEGYLIPWMRGLNIEYSDKGTVYVPNLSYVLNISTIGEEELKSGQFTYRDYYELDEDLFMVRTYWYSEKKPLYEIMWKAIPGDLDVGDELGIGTILENKFTTDDLDLFDFDPDFKDFTLNSLNNLNKLIEDKKVLMEELPDENLRRLLKIAKEYNAGNPISGDDGCWAPWYDIVSGEQSRRTRELRALLREHNELKAQWDSEDNEVEKGEDD